jgi:hypothetical protein
MLMEQYENDGRALIAAGDERSPYEFREMVDAVLLEEVSPEVGRPVSKEERELRDSLGVG